MKKTINKALSWLLSVAMMFGVLVIGNNSIIAEATQDRSSNFSKDFSLGSDQRQNLVNVANAQMGKTKANLGYTEAWCANFVTDCARLTGMSDSIIPYNYSSRGGCRYLIKYMKDNCGAYEVSDRQKGDLVFYYCSSCGTYVHVGIVMDGTYSIEGNYGGKVTKVSSSYTDSKGHTLKSGTIRRVYVRPNYGNQPLSNFPGSEDTSYEVPVSLKAKQKGNTYDNNGNIESNRWIDAGDDCYIEKVYTNGFCRVEYPSGNTRRWAYAKASLFDIPKKQTKPQGHVMSESEAAGKTIPDGEYFIVNEMNPNYFIDIPGNDFNTKNSTNVAMWSHTPLNEGYDCFKIEYINNGFYKIRQINTNMCLDVNGASLNMETNVQMYEDNSSNAQQWSIERTSHGYRLRSRCNAYYLDVQGGVYESGTNLWCYEGNDSKAQSFSFIPRNLSEKPIADGIYTIKTNVDRAYYLDVFGSPGEFKAGSNVQLYKFNNAVVAEKYTIKYVGDGWYKISEKTSGLLVELVDPNGGFLANSRNIQVFSDNGGKHQLWKIRKNSDGTFFIINKASGYYLDLENAKTENGTNVSQYPYNGNNNQRWVIELETYNITYNMNGGSGSISNQTKTYGQDLTLSSTKPTRTGYTFIGWNTNKDATTAQYQPSGKYTANSGATLYAIWKINTWTVSYNMNGGSGSISNQTKTYGQDLTLSSTKPTRTGYDFVGWNTSTSATTAQYQPGGKYTANSGATLYAIWKAKQIKVTFYRNQNSSDNTTATQTFTYGASGQSFSNKNWTKDGYTLLGWSENRNATEKQYSITNGVGSDWINQKSPTLNLYAVWKINAPTEQPVISGLNETYNAGENITITWNKVDRATSYQVEIWRNPGTEAEKIIDTTVSANSYTLTNVIPGKHSVWIYAVNDSGKVKSEKYWCFVPYTIKYDLNGGTGSIPSTSKIQFTDCNLSETIPTRNGYDFVGWNTDVSAKTAQYQPGDKYTTESDVTLYAIWKIQAPSDKPKITNLNDIYYSGESVTITWNSVDRASSYWINIWQNPGTESAKIVNTYVKTNSFTLNDLTPGKYGITVDAKNESGSTASGLYNFYVPFTIKYDLNGGTGTIASTYKKLDIECTLSSTKPIRTDYTFAGWSTDKNSSTAQYLPGEKYTGNEDVTLYAVWVSNQYTVNISETNCKVNVTATYNGNCIEVSDGNKVPYGTKLSYESQADYGYYFGVDRSNGNKAITSKTSEEMVVTDNVSITEKAYVKNYRITAYTYAGGYSPIISGRDYAPYNTYITVTAGEAFEGYKFIGWYLNGQCVSTDEVYQVKMTSTISICARYEKIR